MTRRTDPKEITEKGVPTGLGTPFSQEVVCGFLEVKGYRIQARLTPAEPCAGSRDTAVV